MSKYTMSLLEMVRMYTPESTESITKRIEESLPKIFSFDFPLYKEGHRKELEKKIVMHYLNKEIGLETPSLWKVYLEMRLNEIMPYYNDLYKINEDLHGINFLEDVNIFEELTGKETHTGTDTVNDNSSFTEKTREILTGETTAQETDNKTLETSETLQNSSISNKNIANNEKTSNNDSISDSGNNTETKQHNKELTNTENTSTNTTNKNILSDFPQGNISTTDYASGSSDTTGSTTGTDSITGSEKNSESNNSTFENNKTIVGAVEKTGTGTEKDTTEINESKTIKNSEEYTKNADSTTNNNKTGTHTGENENIKESTFDSSKDNLTNTHKHGLSGIRTVPAMIKEYREQLLNIDMMIISELSDLFMNIY